jgi:hypothetical protein
MVLVRLNTDQLAAESGFGKYPDNRRGVDLALCIRTGFDPQQTIFIFQIKAPSADVSERTQPAGRPVRSLTGVDVGAKEQYVHGGQDLV